MKRRRDPVGRPDEAPLLERLARWVLLATVFATMTLVDVRAEAAFDAPKRIALVAGVAAAALLVSFSRSARWLVPRGAAAWIAGGVGVVATIALASALLSEHRAVSLESLGIGLVLLVAGAIAASSIFDGHWSVVPTVFLAGSLVNAVLALAQRGGLQLFAVEQVGGRTEASALSGNDGHLALLVAVGLMILATRALSGVRRTRLLVASAPLLAVLVTTRSLTGLLMLLAGAGVLVLRRLPGRRLAAVVGAIVVIVATVGGYVATRSPDGRGLDVAKIDRLSSYRLAPWAAAVEMAIDQPLTGAGPGTFSVESTAYRTKAEARWHRRLQNPFLLSGSFGEAHNEPLQLAAEVGLPAALAVVLVWVLLVVSLLRNADPDAEGIALVVIVIGVAALTWFPAQIAPTALLLALCVGRGVRVLSATRSDAVAPAWRTRAGLSLATAVLLLAVVPSEARRYAAERTLYRATGMAKAIAAGAVPPGGGSTVLRRVVADAQRIVPALPADRRPGVLWGTASMLLGDRQAALEGYRAALATGESAEVDLNIARALRTGPEARDALVRAVWLTDAIAEAIPESARASVIEDVAHRQAQLATGDPAAIPPAPFR